MPYVLDANTLIQAKNEYYAFDICPGFWEFLDAANLSGNVSSIEPIADELRKGKDDLATWAAARCGTFFQPLDAAAHAEMTVVATWVQQQDFREDAKRVFFAGADPFLIAFAKAHALTRRIARGARGGTEKQSEDPDRLPGSRSAVRPDVCNAPGPGSEICLRKIARKRSRPLRVSGDY